MAAIVLGCHFHLDKRHATVAVLTSLTKLGAREVEDERECKHEQRDESKGPKCPWRGQTSDHVENEDRNDTGADETEGSSCCKSR